jgi:ketosteroid isomerase-like protein
MKRAVALLALLALGACTARDPERTADRKEILEGERAWGQAFVTGDAATIDRLLAADFTGIDPTGIVYDKPKMLKAASAGPNSTSVTLGTVIVRFYGDTAIAQGSEHEVGPAPGKIERDSLWTDVWVKQGGHWRIEAAQDVTPQA